MVKTSLVAQTALVASASAALFPDCANGPLSNNTVCDTSASIQDRVQGLINALTNEEKFNLTGSTSPGVPRLGIPSYVWWNEALHGVASSPGVTFNSNATGDYRYATSFPQPSLMGAAFDDALIRSVATVVSTEARAFNNANRSGLDYWTPNINPCRDPRWGRCEEVPGEDPYHLQQYVYNLIDGLQGGIDLEQLKVVATCKHFAAYDLEDWHGILRYEFDPYINLQDLAEYFMPTFQTCARDAKVSSIMCSYNALNGTSTCLDPYILQDVLRDHWNWTQPYHYVTTDCDSLESSYGYQHYADSREQTVADALMAGTDLNCGTYYPQHLPAAFAQGLFNQSSIDQAISRLYSALIKLGYFDPADSSPYRAYTFSDVATNQSTALALRAAEESMVLLKNDGTLPLQIPEGQNITVAIVGGYANATTNLQGNYQGIAPFLTSPYQALSRLPNVDVILGGTGGDPTTDGWPAVYNPALQADVIIYAEGTTQSTASEDNDRNTIGWTGAKIDLVSWLAELGKPTIVVQMGDQLDNAPFLNNPNVSAILWGGYPGQDGGTAIVNLLTGQTAPAGRLPVTEYPADYINQVEMTDMELRPNSTSGNPGRTYKWFNNATLPFGYGLHYTTFNVSVSSDNGTAPSYDIGSLISSCGNKSYLDLCPFTKMDIDVQNTGNVTSDFVTLLFRTGQAGPQPYPIKELVGYQRLFGVQGGSLQTVSINVTLGSMARRDASGNLVLYPGDYAFLVDVPTQATFNFTLTGSETTIENWPQPRSS